MFAVLEHLLQRHSLIGRQRIAAWTQQHRTESNDRIQRRAKLVRHAGEEVGFHLVSLLDLLVFCVELLVTFVDFDGEIARFLKVHGVRQGNAELGNRVVHDFFLEITETVHRAEHQNAENFIPEHHRHSQDVGGNELTQPGIDNES